MIERSRADYLDEWVNLEMRKRFTRVQFFDFWSSPDHEYLLHEYEYYYSEFIDKHEQDTLVMTIYSTFTDYRDLDYIRTMLYSRCRMMFTLIERYYFKENMHRLIKWCLENEQLERQLCAVLFNDYKLPLELVIMILDFALPYKEKPEPILYHF